MLTLFVAVTHKQRVTRSSLGFTEGPPCNWAWCTFKSVWVKYTPIDMAWNFDKIDWYLRYHLHYLSWLRGRPQNSPRIASKWIVNATKLDKFLENSETNFNAFLKWFNAQLDIKYSLHCNYQLFFEKSKSWKSLCKMTISNTTEVKQNVCEHSSCRLYK